MKSLILYSIAIFIVNTNFAQVGVGTTTPAASSILELKTSTKGFLPPRLTTQQIKDIPAPEAGLMVYNLNQNRPCYYNGSNWVYFDTTLVLPRLGTYNAEAGGIVIFLDGTGLHGFAAATSDQGTGFVIYGCAGTNIPGAQFTAVGTGQSNTNAIVAFCNTAGIAARLCNDLVLNSYSDWYLPSVDELLLMFQQSANLQGLGGGYFWSSTQVNANQAKVVDFGSGGVLIIGPGSGRNVRAIRNF